MMIVNEFWDMVSLLETVLAHNKLEDHESLHNISFFTEQIYKELQLNFPELAYWIMKLKIFLN